MARYQAVRLLYVGADRIGAVKCSIRIEQVSSTWVWIAFRLSLLGWTQEEISEKLQVLWPSAKGNSRDSVTDFLGEIGNFRFLPKNDMDKGHDIETVAKRHGLPNVVAWAIALDGMSDKERMDKLKINIQPYDVWNFPSCHELFGDKHPGSTVGIIKPLGSDSRG